LFFMLFFVKKKKKKFYFTIRIDNLFFFLLRTQSILCGFCSFYRKRPKACDYTNNSTSTFS
jgi:hypothetical protein